MKKSRLLGMLLMTVALVATGVTFAYWASGITAGTHDEYTQGIKIGEGESVVTKLVVTNPSGSNLDLVPVGRVVAGESVSQLSFTFTVHWTSDVNDASLIGAKADLSVVATLDGLDTTVLGLFTVNEIATQEVLYNSTTTFVFTVTFVEEPANAAEYALVANKELNLNVKFTMGTVTPA